MILREYQTRAIADLRAAYTAGSRAPCLVLPTGAGKTIVAAEIIRSAIERGRRVLVLVHRYELMRQTVHKLELAGVTNVRTIQANNDLGDPLAPVIVASVQTLTTRDAIPRVDFVICDEAHHFVAKTFAAIIAVYPGARLLGLTATPQRGDGRPLGDVFDAIVVGSTICELTALGHLVPCIPYGPAKRLDSKQIAQSPAEAYRLYGDGRRCVVFCVSVTHASEVAASMSGVVVHGGMTLAERTAILASKPRVLVNCFVLSEGWDDPEVGVCILTRAPGHASTYLQMVGRILRPFPGKTDAILIDLAGAAHVHGTPDADRTYTLDGKGIATERQQLRQCPACGRVFVTALCPCGFISQKPLELPSVIGATVGRLPALPAPAFTLQIAAKFPGKCSKCFERISIGTRIYWTRGSKFVRHVDCSGRNALDVANELMRGVQ